MAAPLLPSRKLVCSRNITMIVTSMNQIVGHWIRSIAERLTRTGTAEAVVIHHSSPAEPQDSTRETLRQRCFLEIGVR
jgi:hypothetical protein